MLSVLVVIVIAVISVYAVHALEDWLYSPKRCDRIAEKRLRRLEQRDRKAETYVRKLRKSLGYFPSDS